MKKITVRSALRAACLVWAAGATVAASAVTLTNVPMQGSMVMPMLNYRASDGSLTIMLDPTVPQLTPLLVSNLGDCFDPADPWCACLEPSRQGLAFSRRYGFTMSTMTDLVPPGTNICIRKLSSSPGLGAYRYRSSAPKAWEPIFGTAGSTNAYQWDGSMFHPGFTAPPGTGTYTATFEAFLVETATGTPVPGGNTGPFVLNWTTVPDGRPTLSIAANGVVSWAPAATNYILEAADSLSVSNWTAVTNIPVTANGQASVVLPANEVCKFFRMRLVL